MFERDRPGLDVAKDVLFSFWKQRVLYLVRRARSIDYELIVELLLLIVHFSPWLCLVPRQWK